MADMGAKSARSQQSLIQAIQRTTAEMEAGSRTSSRYFDTLAQQRGIEPGVLQPYLQQLRAIEQAQQSAGQSAGQTRAAMQQLPAQITDIVTSLQAGQQPLTVLIQQGGQLRDSFGGAGAAARALGGQLLAVINPYTLLAAAAVGVSYAYLSSVREADAYVRALGETGNAAGATKDQMAEMARQIGKSDAAEALLGLAKASQVSAENMQRFAVVAVEGQRVLGKSIADTVSEFDALGGSPVETLAKLNEKYHFLTAATYAQVKALEDVGKTAEAATLAQTAYADGMDKQRNKVLDSLSDWERGWIRIKKAASDAVDSALGMGRATTDAQKIGSLLKDRERIEENIATNRARRDSYGERQQQALLEQNQAQINAIRARTDAERAAAKAEADAAQAEEARIRWMSEGDKFLGKKAQLERDIAKARNEGAAAGVSVAEIEERVAKIREKYVDKGAASKQEAARRQEAAMLAELSGVTSSYMTDLSRLNALREKGNITEARYVELVTELISKQPGAKKMMDETAKEMADYAKATTAANDALDKELESLTKQIQAAKDHNEQIGLSTTAIAELEAVRLESAATLKEENADIAEGLDLTGKKAEGLREEAKLLRELAAAKRTGAAREVSIGVDLASATDMLKVMEALDDSARQAASGMESAFGRVGKTIGGLTTSITGLGRTQAAIAAQLTAATKSAGGDQAKIAAATSLAARQTAQAQIQSYGDMAGAAKGFFDEHSRGYRAMEAAEKTFRAFEMGLALKTMLEKSGLLQAFTSMFVASKATETAATTASVAPDVAASMIKGQAAAAAGVAAQAQGDPYTAWPRMAAMAAVMVGLGFAISGIGGGKDTTAIDRQKATGTGSVLGDSTAKSESIAKAIELSAANSNIELNYTAGMLRALLSIESALGNLGSLLIRNGNVGGKLPADMKGSAYQNASALAFGGPGGLVLDKLTGGGFSKVLNAIVPKFITNIVGKIGNAIFGGNVTTLDGGITASAISVANARNGGLRASGYVDTKKDGGLFHSDKYRTALTALGPEANQQFSAVIGGIAEAVEQAGSLLGVGGDAFTQRLNAFVVDIGKISTKDLKPDEIQAQLEAAFSKVGDDMARFGVGGLEKFQQVGEGYLETLARVANNYANLDAVLSSIGMTFGTTGLSSIEARERLIDLAGGIDELASKTASFAQNYLTEAERLAPVQKYVTDQLASMGLAGLRSRESFKQYVLGLDLTSDAQRQQYVALMDLQEAFAKIYPEIEDLTVSVTAAKAALVDAYNSETEAIGTTIDRMGSFAASLRNLGKSALLGNLSPLSPTQKYAEARAQYDAVASAARAGDQGAQDRYQEAYTAFLEASRAVNASSTGYQQDFSYAQAMTEEVARWAEDRVDVDQAQLDMLKSQVSGIIEVNKSVLSVRDALQQYNEAMSKNTAPMTAPLTAVAPPVNTPIPYSSYGTQNTEALVAEVKALRSELEGLRGDQQKQTGEQITANAEAVTESAVQIAKAVRGVFLKSTNERVAPE